MREYQKFPAVLLETNLRRMSFTLIRSIKKPVN